mgnify:CR=1 FL=1
MSLLSPDGAPEDKYEHDVRPLDVEEACSLRAASEHAPEKRQMLGFRLLIDYPPFQTPSQSTFRI